MKRKTLAMIISLALALSLSACGNDKFPDEDNSDAERIAELEQELEELKAQQSQDDNENSVTEQEENQQPVNEVEGLLKTTVESPETSGVCGADLTWYYQNGILAITGTGEMTDYSSYKDTPWYDLRDKIGWVIIDEGATTVGEEAFAHCGELSKIVLPNSLTSIGREAFSECENIREITIPISITMIAEYPFSGCINVKKLTFKGNIPEGIDMIYYFKKTAPMMVIESETEDESRRRWGEEYLLPMTIYYTGDTFDEFINSYPYWSDYGVEWIKQ